MAMRSLGGVSITLMSRSPTSDICSVRGIGVADMVSTSTSVRICLMRSLWRTPKRCSSSTTSRPRSANFTSFDSRRCVPIRMSTLPASTLCKISLTCFGVRKLKRCESLLESFVVLECEHGGGREHGDLLVVAEGLESSAHRHFGFAVTHVAAQQSIHGGWRLHVPLH